MSEDHFLASFLQEELPKLGLDYETYGPYVMTDTILTADDDEWDAVVELLQASSETHSDDTEVWMELKTTLQDKQRTHKEQQDEQEHQHRAQQIQQQHDILQQEIRLAQSHPIETTQQRKSSALDAQKKALVDRYAYDESERYDDKGNLVVVKGDDATDASNNKQVAQQAHLEQSKLERQQYNTSKKAEREGTAKAKQEKARIKEERRKRATKGERKR